MPNTNDEFMDRELDSATDADHHVTEDDTFLAETEKKLDKNMVDLITFTLTCELSGMQLSLNELLDLKEGDMLDYINSMERIMLKINGITIGHGELVNIDGSYGVKINKLYTTFDALHNS